MSSFIDHLFDPRPLTALNQPLALVYIAIVFALLVLGRWLYSATVDHHLNDELGHHDNPAVGVAFAGYMFALGAILWSVLTVGGHAHLATDLADFAVTGTVGAVLLQLGQLLVDRLSFRHFSIPEAVRNRNVSAGLVTAGGYVGTGLILASALEIEGHQPVVRLLDGGVFFVAGQLAFIVATVVYQKATRFDLAAEVQAGNAAVGLSYGLSLVAVGHLLSYAISQTSSLIVLVAWFVGSGLGLHLFRLAIDKLVLAGHDLDQELARDKNWGVALVEGSLMVVLARIVTGAF